MSESVKKIGIFLDFCRSKMRKTENLGGKMAKKKLKIGRKWVTGFDILVVFALSESRKSLYSHCC